MTKSPLSYGLPTPKGRSPLSPSLERGVIEIPPNSSLFVRINGIGATPAALVQMVGYRTNGERWAQLANILANTVSGVQDVVIVLPEGSLVSVLVNVSGITASGSVFGSVWVGPTGSTTPNISQAVCRGWVSALPSCAFPSPGWPTVADSLGNNFLVELPAPAVGTGALLSMSGFTGDIRAVHLRLVTDANIAFRFPRIRITEPLGSIQTNITSSVSSVASTTYDVNFVPGGDDVAIATTNLRVCMFDQPFSSLAQITIDALNLQVGDQISQVTLMVRMNPEIF